jgi:cell fate (sporulation/competence/biofilm development) regulator YmcA (YheA/YmcA/DUF963 family)
MFVGIFQRIEKKITANVTAIVNSLKKLQIIFHR